MKRKILAILMALVALIGIPVITAPAANAGAYTAWCEGHPFTPEKSSGYVIGTGNMQCNNYNVLTGWRMQLVLQDTNGNNIAGTATGWIYTPSWSYVGRTNMNNSSLCLNGASKRYRTEIQISATHETAGYSGIAYGQSGFNTISCGIAGYS